MRGGTPVELADALAGPTRHLARRRHDRVLARGHRAALPHPGDRGAPTAITTLDAAKRERTHRFPCALDGGPWVVFTVQTVESPGGYDDASIDAVSVETGERRHLYKGARRAVWAPGGFLLLARGNDLYAVPIDPRDPRIAQDPVPVLAGVSGDVSSGCVVLQHRGRRDPGVDPRGRAREDARGGVVRSRRALDARTPVPAMEYRRAFLSPDGRRALLTVRARRRVGRSLGFHSGATGALTRVTHGGLGGSAVWLPGRTSIRVRPNGFGRRRAGPVSTSWTDSRGERGSAALASPRAGQRRDSRWTGGMRLAGDV